MKQLSKIDDTLGSYILTDNLIYLKNNILFENNRSIIKVDYNVINILEINKSIFFEILSNDDGFERTLSFDKENKVIYKNDLLYNKTLRNQYNNYIGLIENDTNFNSIWGVYDIDKNEIFKLNIYNPDLFQIISDKILVYSKSKILTIYYFETTIIKQKWQFSIENFPSYQDNTGEVINAKIKQIIGVYDNVLWIHIGKFHLVGIDIFSGQKMHYIENLPLFLGLTQEEQREFVLGMAADYNFHLDKQQGVLKTFANRYYIEIDLTQMKGSVKKDFGGNFQASWRIKQSMFYEGDNNLYFTGARKGEVVSRAVGIFDAKKCDVSWYEEPLEEKKFLFFTEVPQSNDHLLAVLDSENNLWLYEK